MNIMEANRSISVSKSHNYTKEKVLLAEKLIADWGKNQRNFPSEKIIEVYNTIKGTQVVESACKKCGGDKYLIGIRNYAKYGRMVLLNEGVNFDEEIDLNPKQEPAEIAPERIQTGIEEEIVPEEVEEPKPTQKIQPKKKTKK